MNANSEPDEHQTATRATQTREWINQNLKVDWMAAPGMADYVNGLVSGRSMAEQGHWALHALRKHLAPMAERLQRPLTMVALGCGDGHIEEALIDQFGWPIGELVGLEYDAVLRQAAKARFNALPGLTNDVQFFDFNNPADVAGGRQFDVVFCCHAIHHATDLENFLPFVNNLMAPEGKFIGIEYLGPSRFQIEFDVLPHIQRLFAILPSELRRNLAKGGIIEDHFEPPTIAEVRDADISESVRSSDLRVFLFSNFGIDELKPMGGTILRWLLRDRAGNFRHEDEGHVAISQLLQMIESQLINRKEIKSDDMFFVLSRSLRL